MQKREPLHTINHTFAILKGRWGIWFDITGYVSNDLIAQPQDRLISQGIVLRVEARLSEEICDFILSGCKWLLSQFPQTSPLVIVITNWEIAWCEFQIEGVFYAAASWLAKALSVNMPEFRFVFSKDENKYLFPDKEYTFS